MSQQDREHSDSGRLATQPLGGTLAILSDLHRVVDMLAAGKTPRDAAMELAQTEGMSRRNAQRYVAAALAMLVRDQAAEPVEVKRARIIAMAQAGYERAMARERGFLVKAGEGQQAVVRVPDPDTKGAAMFLALLAKIEGAT